VACEVQIRLWCIPLAKSRQCRRAPLSHVPHSLGCCFLSSVRSGPGFRLRCRWYGAIRSSDQANLGLMVQRDPGLERLCG
jgi:hypothetical protein